MALPASYEALRRKHVQTLEVCQRLADENSELRKRVEGTGDSHIGELEMLKHQVLELSKENQALREGNAERSALAEAALSTEQAKASSQAIELEESQRQVRAAERHVSQAYEEINQLRLELGQVAQKSPPRGVDMAVQVGEAWDAMESRRSAEDALREEQRKELESDRNRLMANVAELKEHLDSERARRSTNPETDPASQCSHTVRHSAHHAERTKPALDAQSEGGGLIGGDHSTQERRRSGAELTAAQFAELTMLKRENDRLMRQLDELKTFQSKTLHLTKKTGVLGLPESRIVVGGRKSSSADRGAAGAGRTASILLRRSHSLVNDTGTEGSGLGGRSSFRRRGGGGEQTGSGAAIGGSLRRSLG